MSEGSQAQKAGANANQLQVSGDLIIVTDMAEERAYEIAMRSARAAIAEFSAESAPVAENRINELDTRVVDRLKRSGKLGALADPAVLVTLRKAQIGAASSERESDYDLLASLLDDRVNRPGDRPIRAGINRAVEVVDQLDEPALLGLTLMQALAQYRPMAGEASDGIATMSRFLSQLVPDPTLLPKGPEWIEHLELLDAVRVSSARKFKPFEEFWPERTPGYVTVGLPSIAHSIVEAHDALNLHLRTQGRFVHTVPHALKPGFERLPYPYSDNFRDALVLLGYTGAYVDDSLTLAREKFHVDEVDAEASAAYMEEVRGDPPLCAIADWWNDLSLFCTATTVGRVLARANAQRLDRLNLLPPLD